MLWSKLQKQLYNIMDPTVNFQMHCSVYNPHSVKCSGTIPRFWITIDKKVVWDFPNMFLDELGNVYRDWTHINEYPWTIRETYFFSNNYTWVSDVIRSYINTPKTKLLKVDFEKDKFGLVDTLKKYDRRISKNKRKKM